MGTGTAVTVDGDDVVVTNVVVLCGSSMLVSAFIRHCKHVKLKVIDHDQTNHNVHCVNYASLVRCATSGHIINQPRYITYHLGNHGLTYTYPKLFCCSGCSNLQFSNDIDNNNKKNSELVQEAQIYIHMIE